MQIPVAQPAPAADTSIDNDIAAFISEGHEPDEVASDEPGGKALPKVGEPRTYEEVLAAEGLLDDEPAPEAKPEGDSEAAPAVKSTLDVDAVTKAIEAEDPVAFVKALGQHADKLLTGKAHKALRIMVRDAEQAQTKASELATRLHERYSDPIAARKAAQEGDPNGFIDMVEKWAGTDFNNVQRWLSQAIAGRPARLEAQKQEAAKVDLGAHAKQEQAKAELTAWVDSGVKKLAPELHSPEVVALVEAEIRAGFSAGINTPALAMPAVRKKLEAQYARLHAVFGKGKPAPAKSPSTKVNNRDHSTGQYRPTTLEEDIRDVKKAAGLPAVEDDIAEFMREAGFTK